MAMPAIRGNTICVNRLTTPKVPDMAPREMTPNDSVAIEIDDFKDEFTGVRPANAV